MNDAGTGQVLEATSGKKVRGVILFWMKDLGIQFPGWQVSRLEELMNKTHISHKMQNIVDFLVALFVNTVSKRRGVFVSYLLRHAQEVYWRSSWQENVV